MLSKRGLITLLVGVNITLGWALLAQARRLPAALAQSGLPRGQYICATAKPAGYSYDVLYVIDIVDHRLHAFYPAVSMAARLVHAPPRDLYADFAKSEGP